MDNAIIEAAAKAAYEVNRTYCASLGDYSQVAWESAADWQRQSAVAGVRAILDDPDAPPSRSHEGWLELKAAEGWTYGEKKDPDKKTHPCIVPYEQLSCEQQAKDFLFGITVRAKLGLPLPTLSYQ